VAKLYDFHCPTCHARVGQSCRENGQHCSPHTARVQRMEWAKRLPPLIPRRR